MGKWDEIIESENHRNLSWADRGRQYDLYKEHLGEGGTADDVRRAELFSQKYERPRPPGKTFPQGEAAYEQELVRGHAKTMQRLGGDNSFIGGTAFGGGGGKELDPEDRENGFLLGMGSSIKDIWNAGEQGVNVLRHAIGNMTTDELAESDNKAKEDYRMGQIASRYGGGEVGAGKFWGDLVALAPLEQARAIQWAKNHPWLSSTIFGGVASGSHPIDMPKDASFGDYLTEKGIQMAPGAIFGFAARAGHDVVARRLRNKATIEQAAEDFNKMLGANTEDSAITGAMTKEYLDWVSEVESVGVSKAYDKIIKGYKGKSVNSGSFYKNIKRMAQDEWDEMGHPVVQNLYKKLRKDLKIQYGTPGKPLTDAQLDKISNPKIDLSIEQLDMTDKKLVRLIQQSSSKMGEGTPKYVLNEMRRSLHKGVTEGHGHDILKTARDTAKQSYIDQGIVIGKGAGRKKISLREYVHGASDEDVVKRVLIDGDEKSVAKTLEIMREGSRYGGGYTKAMGNQAVDNMRAILFKEGMELATDMSTGSPIFKPDIFWKFVHKKVGLKKMKMIFDEGEMVIVEELGKMDNRGLFDAVKAIFAGPRLTIKKKAIREGLGLLMTALYRGKQTTEFADAVAGQLGVKGWRGGALDLANKTPSQILFGLMGREDSGRYGSESGLQKGAR